MGLAQLGVDRLDRAGCVVRWPESDTARCSRRRVVPTATSLSPRNDEIVARGPPGARLAEALPGGYNGRIGAGLSLLPGMILSLTWSSTRKPRLVFPAVRRTGLDRARRKMVVRSGHREQYDAEACVIRPSTDITRTTVLQPGDLLTTVLRPDRWVNAEYYSERAGPAARGFWPGQRIGGFAGRRRPDPGIQLSVNGVAPPAMRLEHVDGGTCTCRVERPPAGRRDCPSPGSAVARPRLQAASDA